ncbi:MAG TPA: aminopeptidase P family protein [Methylomirabilota bacterium]|jgi:Xaa-Pro aminopeptidase|nr:aminopeptidase P family protein [Methylomirabilota bacterium]
MTVREKIERLRAELRAEGLAGFLVPRADEHQGEYVPPRAQRLAWLTGFTGSAGLAVVLLDAAAIFVDGRYTLQVRDETPGDVLEPRHVTDSPPADWLRSRLRPGDRLGYDPWLHTIEGVERLQAACARAGASLVPVPVNLVDRIWADQPPPPRGPIVPHDQKHAGRPSPDKRREIGDLLATAGVDAAVLTAPDSIAWLLNVRGDDVAHTPVPLAFALIHRDGTVDLFVDPAKVTPGLREHLGDGVRLEPPDALGPALDRLGAGRRTVQADPAGAAAWVFQRLAAAGATVTRAPDPCLVPKARKNDVELAGARSAHEKDGVALCRFLAWLAREAPRGELTEIAAAARLDALRAEEPLFRDVSFPTISGAGPNGAIVHYRATPRTDRRIAPDMLYLVDSGAQYLDGTTDVTRTVAIGTPTAEQRDRFTRVLKGHVALATARFPKGTTGSQLDVLARAPLWAVGLDYDHGTGHGVGSYLSVHEGPQRISKVGSAVALQPGMILSNEPGYYKAGEYGIRIESLVVVVALPTPPGGEVPLYGFETLTLAPLDRALIEPALLAPAEVAWIDEYHARVRQALTPRVDAETAAWLARATEPLSARPPRGGAGP